MNYAGKGVMKRLAVVAGAFAGMTAAGVVVAAAAGTPEIDMANATMSLQASARFKATGCAGEDATDYITYRGAWTGAETETTPGLTDYSLSGSLTVARVVWTVNQKSGRGVLKGAVSLKDTSGKPTYSGNLTLVTQGKPVAGANVAARGWISAATYTNSATDGGSLLANVEFTITSSFGATGAFGDGAPTSNTPNFSVTTANQTC